LEEQADFVREGLHAGAGLLVGPSGPLGTWTEAADGHVLDETFEGRFGRVVRRRGDPPADLAGRVGRLLLDAAMDEARSRGFVRLVLNPSERSMSFYERAGFGPSRLLQLDL